jgi:hypothetical protein
VNTVLCVVDISDNPGYITVVSFIDVINREQ